jgi:hypothetical protein
MQIKTFTSGRIRAAHFDPATAQLELHWDNRSVLAYKQVPQEVYRRLCSAPNPAAYWEDRIAEEYPKATSVTKAASTTAELKFRDLFGGGDEPDNTNDAR